MRNIKKIMSLSRDLSSNPFHQHPSFYGKLETDDYDSAFLSQIDTNKHHLVKFNTSVNNYDLRSGNVREIQPVGWAFYKYTNIDYLLSQLRPIKADVKFEDIQQTMEETFWKFEGLKVHKSTEHSTDINAVVNTMNREVIKWFTSDYAVHKERQMYYQNYRMNFKGVEDIYSSPYYTHRKSVENDTWS